MIGVEKVDVNERVGKGLARVREAKGVSQEDLARAMGVPLLQLRSWEKGSMHPGAAHLMAAKDVLGVEMAAFFENFNPDNDE